MRDDFSQETKDLLAKRVGFRCSNPNCRKPTSGPQINPSKSINIGVASHITAASPGGMRYDSNLTASERTSANNGIWLCQTHGKLIDNDEIRYTVELLNKWKILSEQAALLDIESNHQHDSFTDNSLVVSINQSGGQTAKTIINQKPQRRTLAPHKWLFHAYLKLVPPAPYIIHILMNDMETDALANELKEILNSEGWIDGGITRGMGGTYPPGITITLDGEPSQRDHIYSAFKATQMKNINVGESKDPKKIGIYIGPNPDNYLN